MRGTTQRPTERHTHHDPRARQHLAGSLLVPLLVFLVLVPAPALPAEETKPEETKPELTPPADAETTPSGLVSKLLQEGTGDRHPDGNDMVAVHFTGWTPAGAKFRSSYDRSTEPAVFYLDQVFPGWREGIGLMVVGEKRRLWIPAHLTPQNPKSGPTGAMIFDVELTGLRPVPDPPANLSEPPPEAEPNAGGSSSLRTEEGQGTEKPEPDSLALVHLTAWGSDGRTFDSTVFRGRPTALPLDMLGAPLAEPVRAMVAGEKRLIWIPESLNQNLWPKAPEGPLVFEIQLLQILPPEALQRAQPAEEG